MGYDRISSITRITDFQPYKSSEDYERVIATLKREILALAIDDLRFSIGTPRHMPDMDIVIGTRINGKKQPVRFIETVWKAPPQELSLRFQAYETEMLQTITSAYQNVRDQLQWQNREHQNTVDSIIRRAKTPPPAPVVVEFAKPVVTSIALHTATGIDLMGFGNDAIGSTITNNGSSSTVDHMQFKERVERFMQDTSMRMDQIVERLPVLPKDESSDKPKEGTGPPPEPAA